MSLTPLQKFLLLVAAGLIAGFNLFWVDIESDMLALGLNEHVFNIVEKLLKVLSSGAVALLALLGLRAPTKGEGDEDAA